MTHSQTNVRSLGDAELLARFAGEGDDGAFAEILRRHERTVRHVCARVLDDHGDVDDASQTTFALLATRAGTIREAASLRSWLYGAAIRTASGLRRRQPRTTPVDDELVSPDPDVLDEIARRHEIRIVSEQVGGLHQRYREPLLLYYYEGLSTHRIAETLQLSVSAVEGRLRRARAHLRSRLLRNGIGSTPVLFGAAAAQPDLLPLSSHPAGTPGGCVPVLRRVPQQVTRLARYTGATLMSKTAILTAAFIGALALAHVHPGHSAAMVPPADQIDTSTTAITDAAAADQTTLAAAVQQERRPTPAEAFHQHLHDLHLHVYQVFRSLHEEWL